MFVVKSLINGVVFVGDVHAIEVLVVKESAADLLVNPGVTGYFDICFIRQPLLDTKSHNIRGPVTQGDSWGSSQ